MKTTQVKQILHTKGKEIWSVGPQATVYEALELMSEKNVGALVVIEKGSLVGIFSERDYARKVILQKRSSQNVTVGELMTRKVFYLEPQSTIEDCMTLMTDKHIRHLPILENERLIGIVTTGDLVKQIIADQEFTIQQLEKYVQGQF